jgi:hypothetical protein
MEISLAMAYGSDTVMIVPIAVQRGAQDKPFPISPEEWI